MIDQTSYKRVQMIPQSILDQSNLRQKEVGWDENMSFRAYMNSKKVIGSYHEN